MARKMTREVARENDLKFYDNGIACQHGHTPIIRMTSTGGCYHCHEEKRSRRDEELESKAAYSPLYYLRFKKKDGTYDVIGPFRRRVTAVSQYKKRYANEYGEPCPSYFFGAAEDGSELEDSDDLD
jgi:hypothetical protein